jgi:hypothetical protein
MNHHHAQNATTLITTLLIAATFALTLWASITLSRSHPELFHPSPDPQPTWEGGKQK